MATTTADMLLEELRSAAEDLMKYGEHEGSCTNAAQMKIAQKIPPCSKHTDTMKKREDRFRRALDQLDMLRDVFGS